MFGFIRRHFFFPALLLSFLVPYFAVNEGGRTGWDKLRNLTSTVFPRTSTDSSSPASAGQLSDSARAPQSTVSGAASPTSPQAGLSGPQGADLPQVMRFDVSPRWVTSNWTRVTTVLGDLHLEGLRVPLVTGTDANDLAGSLTYYFDGQQRVQRITFRGTTGDERKLVQFVNQYYGLQPQPSLAAGLYLKTWNRNPTSGLLIRHASVVQANMPHHRMEVALELNRPDMHFGLSDEFRQFLSFVQGAQARR